MMKDWISRATILNELDTSLQHFGNEYTPEESRLIRKFRDYIATLPSACEWMPFILREPTNAELVVHPNAQFIMDQPRPVDGQEILVTDGETVWIDRFSVLYGDAYLNRGTDFMTYMWMPLPEVEK